MGVYPVPIEFKCVGCGKAYRVADTMAGKPVACKKCGRKFNIPAASPAAGGSPPAGGGWELVDEDENAGASLNAAEPAKPSTGSARGSFASLEMESNPAPVVPVQIPPSGSGPVRGIRSAPGSSKSFGRKPVIIAAAILLGSGVLAGVIIAGVVALNSLNKSGPGGNTSGPAVTSADWPDPPSFAKAPKWPTTDPGDMVGTNFAEINGYRVPVSARGLPTHVEIFKRSNETLVNLFPIVGDTADHQPANAHYYLPYLASRSRSFGVIQGVPFVRILMWAKGPDGQEKRRMAYVGLDGDTVIAVTMSLGDSRTVGLMTPEEADIILRNIKRVSPGPWVPGVAAGGPFIPQFPTDWPEPPSLENAPEWKSDHGDRSLKNLVFQPQLGYMVPLSYPDPTGGVGHYSVTNKISPVPATLATSGFPVVTSSIDGVSNNSHYVLPPSDTRSRSFGTIDGIPFVRVLTSRKKEDGRVAGTLTYVGLDEKTLIVLTIELETTRDHKAIAPEDADKVIRALRREGGSFANARSTRGPGAVATNSTPGTSPGNSPGTTPASSSSSASTSSPPSPASMPSTDPKVKVEVADLGSATTSETFHISPRGGHIATRVKKDGGFAICYDGVTGSVYEEIPWVTTRLGRPDSREEPPCMVWSRDGNRYAYIGYSDRNIIMIVDGKEITRFPAPRPAAFRLQLTGDTGKRMMCEMSARGRIDMLELWVDGKKMPGKIRDVDEVLLSSDGSRFAYIATVDKFFVTSAIVDGQDIDLDGDCLAFSGDGKHYYARLRKGDDHWLVTSGRRQKMPGLIRQIYTSPKSEGVAVVLQSPERGTEFLYVNGKVVEGSECSWIKDVMISPDGKRIAAICHLGQDRQVVFLDGKKGREYHEIPSIFARTPMAFSVDSSKFAYIASKDKKQYVVVNEEESMGYFGEASYKFSADGKRVAHGGKESILVASSVTIDGKTEKIALEAKFDTFVFSLDGSRYAYEGDGGQVFVDGKPTGRRGKFVFSPDGKHFVDFSSSRGFKSGLFVNGKLVYKYPEDSQVIRAQFTPDSKHLYWLAATWPRGNPGGYPEITIFLDGKPVTSFKHSLIPGVKTNPRTTINDPRLQMQELVWDIAPDGSLTYVVPILESIRRYRITPNPETNIESLLTAAGE